MSDTDCEIEFLDEDADIVQQCVQVNPVIAEPERPVLVPKLDVEASIEPLLIEKPLKRKKKKEEEEDSDYDPTTDQQPPSPPVMRVNKKRKIQPTPRQSSVKKLKTYVQVQGTPNKPGSKKMMMHSKFDLMNRKKLGIQIPDYDDPLCLPAKAVTTNENEIKRLKNWNNLCLNHFEHCDTMLRPDSGEGKSSTRTILLKNVRNKEGKIETTIWSKTCVESKEGDKKSEIFQCVLPKYRERTHINTFSLVEVKKPRHFHHVNEVLLTKEVYKDEEMLVAYKPRESLSAVYKFKKREQKDSEGNIVKTNDDKMRVMKEVVVSKVCAPCYQTSWRGVRKQEKVNIQCPICRRTFVTVYNLLSHVKGHPTKEVLKYKRQLSVALADVLSYHYKCRVCQEQFLSIKDLRNHVPIHRGTQTFLCEVGQHMAC